MRMRWLVLVGALSLGALVLSLLPPCSYPLLAQSGCCKTRSAPNAAWTKRLDLDFAACRAENQQRDKGDNLFEPTGLVWWDQKCS